MTISRRGLGSRSHFAEQFAKRFKGGATVGRLLDQALDNVRAVSVGLPREHQSTHLANGSDALQPAGTTRALVLNVAGVRGHGPSYSYEDHTHDLDLLLTAKGDSLTKSDASTYIREAVGANDSVLMADSAQATGRIWSSIASVLAKILTSKGDLLTHNGSTTVRKAVGANGTVLTADSATSDGLRWGTVAALTQVVLTPPQLTADQNDYNPGTANVYRLSSDAHRVITGMVAGTDGEVRYLLNVGTQDIELSNENVLSAAANRFIVAGPSSLMTLGVSDWTIALYDTITARWRVLRPPLT
jgi:hypothetical protein